MTSTNGVGQHLAWTDYADLLASVMAEPKTARRAAEGHRAKLPTVRKLMRLFRDQRLVHIVRFEKESKATPAAVYAYGCAPDAAMPPTSRGLKSAAMRPERVRATANLLAFANIVRNLEQGQTLKEISEATGSSYTHLRILITHMRKLGIVHICEYQKQGMGTPPAVYRMGRGRDAAYPKAETLQEKSARQYRDRKARQQILIITHALAGTLRRPVPELEAA